MNRVSVSKHPNGWQVKIAGNERASNVCSTQAEARTKGIELAKKLEAEFTLHNENGQIREKNSYGNDPRNIRG
ncbi:DUF2188 domain-containing protein [Aliarcobacter butzleri]|uniref:DUF2188 domain-containing protein n=1 Tax=Aliarcobacter butzleri TaxID=28197 RepID=UPI00263F37D3|nr:DUF2188 domain-containing protein [Aliarcobacter butzleri]MDN5109775.1 DUF2188 domain-containing protein [Aliarcobacter butzleri]